MKKQNKTTQRSQGSYGHCSLSSGTHRDEFRISEATLDNYEGILLLA